MGRNASPFARRSVRPDSWFDRAGRMVGQEDFRRDEEGRQPIPAPCLKEFS